MAINRWFQKKVYVHVAMLHLAQKNILMFRQKKKYKLYQLFSELIHVYFLFLFLQAKLPATSKVIPLIAIYYACTFIEVSAAMGMACLMLRFYHPDNSSAPIPAWIRVTQKYS